VAEQSYLKDEGVQLEEIPGSCTGTWNVGGVKKDAEFHLGKKGTLSVLRKLKHCSVLEMEWEACLSETVQEVRNVAGNQMALG
jgi:hypothetical protein